MSPSTAAMMLLLLLHAAVPPTSANCPRACECSSWLETYVACRGTNLSEPPLNTYTPSLETLYFTFNKEMTVVRDGELAAAQYATVRSLVLNNNAISVVEDQALVELTKLRHLDLSGNDITAISQQVFAPTKRLTRLNLSGNKQLELPEPGWNLPRLTVLSLRGCTLDAIPLHFFVNMPNLKNIKLDRNKFSTIDGNVFRPIVRTLELLDLSINKFTQLPRGVLEVVPAQVELHLEHNRYHCDCEFQRSYCLYEARPKKTRLPCKTPKKMRGVDGGDVIHLLSCGSAVCEAE